MTTKPLGEDAILHLWDTQVGEPTEKYPFTDKDKIAFARAVLAAAEQDRGGEAVAWASPNVIPLREGKDNHPCVLTATRCAANTVPLYAAPPQPGGVSETDAADAARYRWICAPLDDRA